MQSTTVQFVGQPHTWDILLQSHGREYVAVSDILEAIHVSLQRRAACVHDGVQGCAHCVLRGVDLLASRRLHIRVECIDGTEHLLVHLIL